MTTMNISLPGQMKAWVEECVHSGRYANSSDHVRDLIRTDHMKLEPLRQALIEGGTEQAEQHIREKWAAIEEQSSALTKSVNIGDVRKGYRKARSAYVIFFKAANGGNLDVVRILRQKMDFDYKPSAHLQLAFCD